MSAWGVGPFENDDGADIQSIWARFIAGSEETWGPEKIGSFFKDVFFRGSLPAISDGNAAWFIAIGQAFHDASLILPDPLKRALLGALQVELAPSSLQAWARLKSKRKKLLLTVAEQHGLSVEQEPLAPSCSKYSKEIESLRTWFDNLEKICSARERMSMDLMAFVDSIKPEFAKAIESQTYEFHDEADEDRSAELGNLRYMYLVWLVLFDLKYETGDIMQAVERARL